MQIATFGLYPYVHVLKNTLLIISYGINGSLAKYHLYLRLKVATL